MAQRRKKYSKEFKERAVELLENTELTASEIAADLDIHPGLLFKWRDKMQGDQEEPFPGKGRLSPEHAELRRLKRENADLKMERDILKKAISIFSQKPKRNIG